jgi:transcriptional regulator with XRE-family HTH domain
MNEEMGIRENIRKAIEVKYSGNYTRFSREHRLSNSYLNEILSGKRRLNEDMLNKIARALHIEVYELFSDKPLVEYESREPILRFNMPEADIEGVKMFEDPICLGPGYNMDDLKPTGHMPIPKDDLPTGYKSEKDRIVCFRTKGYSMEPTIFDDSYAWIDRYVEHCLPGEIYAFLLEDNSVTVKRLLRKHKDYLIIGADNPAQDGFPMILKLREIDEPSVVRGRVIWILNRFIKKAKE